jgi:molybdopterin adenylyltransferase
MTKEQTIKIGVVVVSDRASTGVYEDRGGPAMQSWLENALSSPFELLYRLIPDEEHQIRDIITTLVDVNGCCLVITTGGTGPAKRDVTVEATTAVCNKLMPGFGELMRKVSLEKVPTAILSRQEAGIRYTKTGGCLIINLPGSPKAIGECLDAVFPAVPYCIDLLEGPYLETDPSVITAFRPKKK